MFGTLRSRLTTIDAPRRHTRRIACALTLVGGVAVSSPAGATDSDSDTRMALQLFDKAVQRMADGKCDASPVGDTAVCQEARELLERAYALSPSGLGALRNLARVERALGMYASAARHLRELIRKAPNDPKPSRRLWGTFARRELSEIEPSIAHLVVRTEGETEGEIAITLDGAKLPVQVLGVPVDVDPGEHVVEATAKGRAPFHATVRVSGGETRPLVLSFTPSPTPTTEGPPARPSPTNSASKSRLAPLVVAGVGAVGVAVGLGLGWVAIDKRVDACGSSHYCEPEGFDEGKTFANISTVVTAVGAATLVAGGLWFFLSPSRRPQKSMAVAPTAYPTFVGLHATSSF